MKGAPFSFGAILVSGLLLGFAAGQYLMRQEVANAESLVKLKDGQIDEYQKTINERLDKVEKTLSAQQLSTLETWLKASPSMVSLSTDPKGTDPFTMQLVDTFKKSGWDVMPRPYDKLGYLFIEPKDATGVAVVLKALMEAKVPFESTDKGVKGLTVFKLKN